MEIEQNKCLNGGGIDNYSPTLKSVTTYNVCAYFYVCLWANQQLSYNVNIVVIGCNADMEICEYIISDHTFEHQAVSEIKCWNGL